MLTSHLIFMPFLRNANTTEVLGEENGIISDDEDLNSEGDEEECHIDNSRSSIRGKKSDDLGCHDAWVKIHFTGSTSSKMF